MESVKVYEIAPSGSQNIGLVNGACNLMNQSGRDKALRKLKIAASKVGANGVVIEKADSSYWVGSIISGKAIFVPQ